MPVLLDWASIGVDQAQFHAYSKLLSIRNEGQVLNRPEETQVTTRTAQGVQNVGGASSEVARISAVVGIDNTYLRRQFLDRLAELVANKPGGWHVSASVMFYTHRGTEVCVARNSGFQKPDLDFLQSLQTKLQRIAVRRSTYHLLLPLVYVRRAMY